MSYFKEPTVTRGEFRRALSHKCAKEFGMGLSDLPDIICIDDNWWENITEKEAIIMIDSCIEEFRLELMPDYHGEESEQIC